MSKRKRNSARILSWNVNGLRAATKKGFLSVLENSGAHVFAVQEVRAAPDQIPEEVSCADGWHTRFTTPVRKGYSGVGLFSRTPISRVRTSLGRSEFDEEGRVQMTRLGKLLLVNAYFPNGNGKDRDNSRVPYKLAFYQRLHELLERGKKRGEPILVMGDFNTAHREIDLARPKQNTKTSGFLPEECEEFERWVASGWEDTFRRFCQEPDHYTWWSQRFGVRERNVGWRIDYVLASPGAAAHVRNAFHLPEIQGSDHCPVGVDVDATLLKA